MNGIGLGINIEKDYILGSKINGIFNIAVD
jgi:hypothetical protein